MYLSALGIHTRFIEATQKCGNDYLLVALVDFVELQYCALSGLEDLLQVKVLCVIEGETVDETLLNTPRQGMHRTGIVRAVAVVITFLFRDSFDGIFQVVSSPGCTVSALFDLTQRSTEQVLLFFGHFGEQVAHIAHVQCRDAYFDLFWLVDLHLCRVAGSPGTSPIALLRELGE